MFRPGETSGTLLKKLKYDGGAQQDSDAPLRFGILVDGRYLARAQPQGMAHALAKGGHCVIHLDPQAALIDFKYSLWLAGVDLIIARGHSADLLARLSAAEAAGVATLNRSKAIAAVIDRTHMAKRLRAAGIPTPPLAWSNAAEPIRRAIPRTAHPPILISVHGDSCHGIRIDNAQGAIDAAGSEPRIRARRLRPNRGRAVKLYVMGNRVWAIRKPSPLRAAAAGAALFTLPSSWRDLARRCGELFGLQVFGVDCIESDGALLVTAVNDFPDYSGVPDADDMLAGHVAHYARLRRNTQTAAS